MEGRLEESKDSSSDMDDEMDRSAVMDRSEALDSVVVIRIMSH